MTLLILQLSDQDDANTHITTGKEELALSVDTIDEIYDVILLPNTRRPMLIGLSGPEIHRYLDFDQNPLDRVEQSVFTDEIEPMVTMKKKRAWTT